MGVIEFVGSHIYSNCRKFAYHALPDTNYLSMDRIWRLVWNCPQRIRAFIGLVLHDVLLTNRMKRRLTDDPCRLRCDFGSETAPPIFFVMALMLLLYETLESFYGIGEI